jgi:hypothetical protein
MRLPNLFGREYKRATQPHTMEDANRVGQCHLRLPRDSPQPATASFGVRCTPSDRVQQLHEPANPWLETTYGDTAEPRAYHFVVEVEAFDIRECGVRNKMLDGRFRVP